MRSLNSGVWAGVVAAALAVAIAGCSGSHVPSTPRVTITADPRTGLAPLSVSFDAAVTGGNGALTYAWAFGDGMSAMGAMTGATATHSYAHGGMFTATLTVTDADGSVGVGSVDIAVGTAAMPAATITAMPSMGAAPLAVSFTCMGTGGHAPLAMRWDFGDGTTATGAMASHTYVARGVYNATCTVTDADGSTAAAHQAITVSLNTTPVAVASATYSGSDAPLDVSFHGEAVGGDGTLTYHWDFGDGMTASTASPMHTFTAAGTYRAVFTVTDADGDFGVDTVAIDVTNPMTRNHPPMAVATITTGMCAVPGVLQQSPMGPMLIGGTTVQLDAGGSTDADNDALTYEWVFVRVPSGSTSTLSNTTVQNPTFVPDHEGQYLLRVFVSDGVNRVASSELTVTSSGPTAASIVSGDMQSAQAGQPLPRQLVAHVQNSCGAAITGIYAQVDGQNAGGGGMTPTDAMGNLSFGAQAGTLAGPGSLLVTFPAATAGHPGVTVTFHLTVTPGPASQLTMDAAPSTRFTDAAGMPITVRVTDGYGNPVTTGGSVSFMLCVMAGPGTGFGMPPMTQPCAMLSTTAGVATTHMFSMTPGDLQIMMQNPNPSSFTFGGYAESAVLDFESGAPAWTSGGSTMAIANEWARGTPSSVGPSACASGTHCYGTVLNGNYAVGTSPLDRSWLEGTLDAWMVRYNPQSIQIVENEYLDTPNTDAMYGCGAAGDGGAAELQVPAPWAPMSWGDVYPLEGPYVHGCVNGRSGTSTGWTRVEWDLGRAGPVITSPLHVRWNLARGTSATVGAGWYIDDVRVRAYFSGAAWVRFSAACSDGADNDSDGRTDYPNDPGCTSPTDDDETDPAMEPQCADGVDNDMDGQIDYPADADCASASGTSEAASCTNGMDDDNDGYVDRFDPECGSPFFMPPPAEQGRILPWMQCMDGIDNDMDGLTDGHDPGCMNNFMTPSEFGGPPPPGNCMDGRDNDFDGWTDLSDPDCASGPFAVEVGFNPMLTCNDNIDNNMNGETDWKDPVCMTAFSQER